MLLNILKKNKPNITESSLKTYNSTLTNFYYENHPKNSNIDINWFDNQDEIINILKNKNNRKRILAALMAITDNNDKYKKLMYDDLKIYNEEQDKQLKTDKQKENWIEYDKIIEIYNQLKLKHA